ncbi:glucose-6-phosphate dehydrogenase [Cellulomonas aerilata]|uniref:Glucose-6-phosphate 1-dehydrogenase n=1 Tax=Cellulomonas aerilata TaxID=515326 RepID=A0A512DC17_9CELL|nr:glucose-6-phosphate dehydrogenase [Cellulomonas aerilata]GEO33770.1 glucose-6-phosphate 1-dehydrogenase [Cellulomonas aerilata]
MSATIIVLGATGDLTARYLLPAMAQLVERDLLGEELVLVGVANDDLDDDSFRARVQDKLAAHAAAVDAGARADLVARAHYVRGDVTQASTLSAALEHHTSTDHPVVLYLALPHVLFLGVIDALRQVDLPADLRVVVEKPFGQDLQGARTLNAELATVLREDQIFRVDHFLAKQTVLNLIGLRFANRVLEPLWDRHDVAAVDIVFDESVDAQARAAYYDRSGALRDMVQNHLLQILTLIAMEPPASLDPTDLSERKVEVLRAVQTLSREDVERNTVRARYTAGTVGAGEKAREVGAYVDAPGVDPAREIETYTEVTLHLDARRWEGVPFRLRTGKALARDRREVVFYFRPLEHSIFPDATPNQLRLALDPDRISLNLNINGLGDPFDLETVDMGLELPRQAPTPYGQLLLAIVEGDTRLSARAEEAEEAWRIVEPILAAWADGVSPLVDYPAGSDGPAASPSEAVDSPPTASDAAPVTTASGLG